MWSWILQHYNSITLTDLGTRLNNSDSRKRKQKFLNVFSVSNILYLCQEWHIIYSDVDVGNPCCKWIILNHFQTLYIWDLTALMKVRNSSIVGWCIQIFRLEKLKFVSVNCHILWDFSTRKYYLGLFGGEEQCHFN